MKRLLGMLLVSGFHSIFLYAQPDAGLFRFPDVSATQIVFSYANDLWLVPKQGGQAIKMSSPPGTEIFPKFSPDGSSIAFTGNYDGNRDVYVIPVTGGVPFRLTEHGGADRVVDWTPDGSSILFASGRESGKERFNQFYTVSKSGGPARKLPLPYAEFGSYSPDGSQMAFVFKSQAFRNWKRYRGGWNASIHIFDFASTSSTSITTGDISANEFPMWHGQTIYFLSDRGSEQRMNLWKYDIAGKSFAQITHFKDYDVHFPSAGPQEIVFEAGGKLYLLSYGSEEPKEVKIDIVTDRAHLKPRTECAAKYIQNATISPDGKRVVIEARGELFSLPAEDGYVKNLTRSSGVAERYPSWSPDGKWIAYWSDSTGENELWLSGPNGESEARQLSSYGAGFRYSLFWSPDNKKLAFIDKAMRILIYDLTTGQTTQAGKALRYSHGQLDNFNCSWSADSRWLAYSRDMENYHEAVFIYDYVNKKLQQVTSGFYDCSRPVFDPEGKYLYFFTEQSFRPYYSDIDNTFIYANSTQIAALSLKKDIPSLLFAKNDVVTTKEEEEKKPEPADDKKDKKSKKPAAKPDAEKPSVAIDFSDIESRLVILPPVPGNYSDLKAAKGRIYYLAHPNTGAPDGTAMLKYFDIEKREEKTVIAGADYYQLSADKQKILVQQSAKWAVIKAEEGQKITKSLAISDMNMLVDPVREWNEIFNDAWRIERDYFYDPHMHGVDWNLVKERYGKLLTEASTREEVDFVIGEMLGELNASHTYHGGGDMETESSSNTGYLGVNYEAEGNFYKIKKIIRGAAWDAEIRSPLDQPGLGIKEGDYLLAVNGVPVTTDREPFAAFQNLANKTIELRYNTSPGWTGSKTVIVETIGNEGRLRNLAWINDFRTRVDEATQGAVGYIYVPSTGIDGQNELIRQFSAQWDKKALIIDERFNNGGQIPDRFIEMLNRTPLAFWAIRDGESWPWPTNAQFGPKVMLINGWSGSGGDAFPDFFRKKGLGPLIGSRTWGGLIGISGVPGLIDGGSITAPSFRMYNPDGTWFKEGHGVDPDIEVEEDPGQLARGTDPQLERAITEIKTLLNNKSFTTPAPPPYEKRN